MFKNFNRNKIDIVNETKNQTISNEIKGEIKEGKLLEWINYYDFDLEKCEEKNDYRIKKFADFVDAIIIPQNEFVLLDNLSLYTDNTKIYNLGKNEIEAKHIIYNNKKYSVIYLLDKPINLQYLNNIYVNLEYDKNKKNNIFNLGFVYVFNKLHNGKDIYKYQEEEIKYKVNKKEFTLPAYIKK